MLEDVNWSYLKEIFSDVIPWSEKTSYSNRATWLEIRGLPLHCWNSVSLKKVAELWGVFEALGENENHSLDCEKATVLISKNQVKRIDEVIEVEIGDRVFQVGVKEIGFNDGTSYPLCNQWKKEEKSCDESISESTSDLKLDSRQKRHEAVEVDRSCSGTEVEVINVMCAEKDRINCLNREKEDCGDIIMEAELMGGVSKDENLTAFHVNGDEESNKKVCSLGHDENVAVGNSLGIQKVISVEKVGQENTRVDGSGIGPIGVSSFQSDLEGKIGVGFKVKAQEFKSSWANMLDETLNSALTSLFPSFARFKVGEDAACGEVLLMQARFIVFLMFAGPSFGPKSISIGRVKIEVLELLGAAPVDVAVLLASWEVCSWSRSGLFAAFIDDGFFAGSWRKCCCCRVPNDVEKVVGSSRMVRSKGSSKITYCKLGVN
ncbi:hypothetical protein V6N13_023819 [Hibiscus sabdariffa]